MISVRIVLKHENTNGLNDILLDVSEDSFEQICETVSKFVESYNRSQLAREPPEPLVFDWILADREDIDGKGEILYGKEPDDDEEDWRAHS